MEGGEGPVPSWGHRQQQLTKPSAFCIVLRSSAMQACATFILLISSRRFR